MLRTLAALPPRTSLSARRVLGAKLTDRLAICLLLPLSVVDDRAAGRQQDFYDNGTSGAGVGANAPSTIPCVAAERSVPAHAGGKSRRAGQRFARGDDLKPAAHLIGNGLFLFEVPLPQRRQPLRAHAGLREARDILGKLDRMRPRIAFRHQTIGIVHAQRLVSIDWAS